MSSKVKINKNVEKLQNGNRPSSSSSKGSSNGRLSSKSGSNSQSSNEKSVVEKEGLIVYGTSLPKRTYRANSLPGSSHRRPSLESGRPKSRHSGRKNKDDKDNCECKSAECLFREQMSLDLSDVNDTDDEDEKRDKLSKQKSAKTRRRSIEKSASSIKSLSNSPASRTLTITRRSSLQSFSPRSTYDSSGRSVSRKTGKRFSISHHPELVYSSNSPNTSTCDDSPGKSSERRSSVVARTCMTSSSSCYTSWMEDERKERNLNSGLSMDVNPGDTPTNKRGEWDSFWHNYNLAAFQKPSYDDCPTPFYDKNDASKDFELNNGYGEDNKCVRLSTEEAKEIIHCAHRLAEILTLALDRKTGVMETKSASTQVEEKRSITVEANSMRHALPLALELNRNCNGTSLVQKRGRLQESMSLQHDPKDVLL